MLAGVHKEVLQWPLLLQLCYLLPSTKLHIVMVSPSLPDDLPQEAEKVRSQAGFCSPLLPPVLENQQFDCFGGLDDRFEEHHKVFCGQTCRICLVLKGP